MHEYFYLTSFTGYSRLVWHLPGLPTVKCLREGNKPAGGEFIEQTDISMWVLKINQAMLPEKIIRGIQSEVSAIHMDSLVAL